jgi:hypothetical protein
MLEATLRWRQTMGLPNLDAWKDIVAVENSTGKMYVRGYDRMGHVVVYMKPCNENTNQHDGNIKHLVYHMERAVACMKPETNRKLCLVIDYNGYSLSNAPPMKTSREVLSILQDHYPERLYRAYCIRPPYVFYGFYSIISPFIDPVTKDKIRMLTNADMNNPHNKLFEDIDRDILEPCVGGHDSRPYDSSVYLNAPFNQCFLTILNNSSTSEAK